MHKPSAGGRRPRLAVGLSAAVGVVAAVLVPGAAAQAATEASYIEIMTGPKQGEWTIEPSSMTPTWVGADSVLRVPTSSVELTPESDDYGWIGDSGEAFWSTTSSSDYSGSRPSNSRVSLTVGPTLIGPPQLSPDEPHAHISLESVEGPGEFSLHGTPQRRGADDPEVDLPQESFRFGTGTQRNGEPQGAGPVDSLPVGQTLYTKARFTASGMYCVNLRSEATLADGTPVSAVGTIRFAVGDEVSVDAACGTATNEELAPPAEPDAPAAPIASVEGDAVTVKWGAPADDGGHPIAGYTVTLHDRGARESLVQEAGADARSAVFENVPAGYYTASVVATNEAGDSPASPRSAEVVVGDSPVRVVVEGHIDAIAPQVDVADDGTETLRLRAHHDDPDLQWMDWDDFVIYTDDSAQQALPDEYTDEADYSFIGEPGTMTWRLPAGQDPNLPWPGLSTEDGTLAALADDATISVTLDAVTGQDGGALPGDVAIWGSGAERNGGSVFSTKLGGSPAGQLKKRGAHEHFNWSFTAPGVYCFAYTIEAEMADGSRQTDRSQLTHIVGSETEPSTVVPCAENPYPEVTPLDPADVTGEAPYVTDGQFWSFASTFEEGRLVTDFIEHDRRRADQGTRRSVEDVILHGEASSSRYWWIGNGMVGNKLSWDATTIDRDALNGDIDWHVTSVDGPGALVTMANTYPANSSVFDTSAGLVDTAVWPGTGVHSSSWRVTAPGKYCIGLEWSATTASGDAVSDSATLTAVVDGTGFEHDEDTLTRTCADGAEGTDPGEDPGEGEDPGDDPGTPPADEGEWDVPNFTESDSGAVILNDGHVDVASLVENGALTTSIKDTIEFGRTEWRDPAETILQVLPDAQSTVPQSEQYRFLGEPGDAYWELPERQQPGLLWPGWSTEQIARDDLQVDSTVDWSLTDATGPGEFSLFASDPRTPGGVNVLFNTRDGITEDDAVEIGQLAHVHGSWAFSAEGAYCLAFERTATLASGEEVSHEFTLAFGVGETNVTGIDPAACFTEPEGRPDREDISAPDLGGLDEGNRGGVEVVGAPFYPGQLVTAIVPQERAGEWVSVWLDEVWLGWAPVSASGELRVRTPSSAEPGDYRLVVEDREDALIGWAGIEIAPAPEGDDDPDGSLPDEEPPADPEAIWDVENGTENEAGAIVLNDGHIDVASLLEDPGTAGTAAVKASGGSELLTRVKDTTESIVPTWHHPDRVVLQLLPESRMRVPEGEQWAFLGEGGVPYYQVSQSPIPGLLWPGWSTEAVATDATEGGFDWALTDKTGPGEFALYQTGSFGDPEVLFNTRDGIDGRDRFEIPKNAHAHGSWAFSEEGNYCLAFERSTTLTGRKDTSDAFVLALAVGRADVMRVDPADCFGEEGPRPPAPAPEDPDVEQPGGDGQNPPDGAEPDGEQPGGDRPDGEQPGGDGQNPPDGAEPDGEQPGGDRPDGEQPGGDSQNRPDGEQPDGDRHEGEQPDGDGQNPPEGEQPDGDQLHSPEDELSPTSGDLNTQLAAGGSVLLLLAGAGALWAARRRRSMGANSSR